TSPRESLGASTHGVESQEDSTTIAFTSVVSHATPLSSRRRRKQIAKKRVTPIVDVADVNLIKFNSASKSDGDPSPYAPYASWEIVPTPLGSIHAYYDIDVHTKHFTSLHELLHMVEKNDLRKLLGNVDRFYQSWRLYPRAHVYVLETMDGRVIYMFVDFSYPLSEATLERMLKHGLEVPKLLVGGDLTMAEYSPCLISKKELTHHESTALLASLEQTAKGKDVSNPFMAMMVCQKPLGYFSSPMIHVPIAGLMLLFHDPAAFGVLAGCSYWFPPSCWFLVAAVWLFVAVLFHSCCWNNDAILELYSKDLSRILKLTLSNSRLGEDCWELQN
nr:hypothetical protein [Tanacetum cinerariifolium]